MKWKTTAAALFAAGLLLMGSCSKIEREATLDNTTLAQTRATASPVMDGNFSDWSSLGSNDGLVTITQQQHGGSNTAIRELKLFADAEALYFYLNVDATQVDLTSWLPMHIYFDADNNASTGSNIAALSGNVGIDYSLEGEIYNNGPVGKFGQYSSDFANVGQTGSAWGFTKHPQSDNVKGGVSSGTRVSGDTFEIEIKIIRSYIPWALPSSGFGVAVDIHRDWSPVGVLPGEAPYVWLPDGGQQGGDDGFVAMPLSSSLTKAQPMTGIVLWTTNGTYNNTDAIALEFSYMKYSDVVTAKDTYNWQVVENVLNSVASRGHQAILRFYYTYPGYASTVPDYIKQWPGYEATWGSSEGLSTEFPDWRCEELQRFHKQFYQKFGERYDNDPRLAFLQTGFGLWSEYHIYDGPREIGRTFPSKDFQREFVLAMGDYYDQTTWSISKDAYSSSYSPFTANPTLKNEKFGIFDDSFMHETHWDYNETCLNYFEYWDRYKTTPVGGEFSYYTAYDQQNALNPAGIHGRTFESDAAKFHVTYMIGNNQPEYRSMARIKEASLATGYRFRITEFKVKENASRITITNTGVAPIYRDAYVAVNGVRASQSLKGLYPGQVLQVEIPSGGSNPTVTIESDHLVSGQVIQFEASL